MPVVTRHGYAAGQQITKRLDALGDNVHSGCFGVPWWFIRVYVVAGGAWGLTATHPVLFAFVARSVREDIPMNTGEKAIATGGIMLAACIGAFIFGNLADSRGRKYALLISFVLAHFASALRALAPNLPLLIAFQFFAGLGLGGVQPIIGALVMELAPTRLRGRVLVYLDAFWPIGMVLAAVLGRELEPHIGWRATLAFNGVALLYTFSINHCLPESPKWLASAGHFDESVRVLRSIEQECSVYHPEDVDDIIYNLERQDAAGNSGRYMVQTRELSFCRLVTNRFRILLQYPYLTRTLVLWFTWFGMALSNHAIDVYLTDLFVDEVFENARETVVVYGILIARLPGNLLSAVFIDRVGRKHTLIGFLLLANAGAIFEAYLTPTTLALLFAGCCRGFAFAGAWGSLYAYTPELYPISIRVMGVSYAWGFNHIGAFAGPALVIWMGEQWKMSIPAVIWTFCGVAFAVVVVVVLFGVETTGLDSDKADYKPSTSTQRTGSVVAYTKHEDEKASASQSTYFI